MSERLTIEQVRKVARLARLKISDELAERYRAQLEAILEYVQRLRKVDLASVEPLSSALDMTSPLGDDVPGPTLDTGVLLAMAPETFGPFIKVPKVLGDGAGA